MEKNKVRLLVVEDEKKLCDMIAKSLHQSGYEVDVCNDGEEALDMIYARSEERRVGKECSEPCRSRWSPYH